MRFKVGLSAIACFGLLAACSSNTSDGAGGTGAKGAAGKSAGTGGKAAAGGSGSGGSAAGGQSSGTGGSGASGAGTGGTGGTAASAGSLAVQSMAFADGTKIDTKYRCMGPSPDLAWSGAPSASMSYAAVLKDVTPGISQGFLHWVIYDIPASVASLPENVPIGYAPAAPVAAHQAPIWNGTMGFNGPCALSGTNTYELTIYALDAATLSDLSMSSKGADAVTAIEAHQLASGKLTVMSSP